MKNLSIIIAALTAGTAPMLVQVADPTQVVQSTIQAPKNGQEAISAVRQTYEVGGYGEFLQEIDDFYRAVKEKGQLEQLAEMRTGYSPEWEEWESRAMNLQMEKSKELLSAVEDEKKTHFVEQVLSVANLSDSANQKAIVQMVNLRSMAPGTGANSDENRLIDIDLEYEYKSLHIDLPGKPISDIREKHCALRMEKMDKMLAAASQFKDPALKEAVALYAKDFDTRLAQSWDVTELNAFTNGKKKPANALEEKIASILSLYQEKFSDLSREFLAEHEKN